MALVDKRIEFGDGADITESAGTYNLPNQYDIGSAGQDIGVGDPLYLVISADTDISTASGSGTLCFNVASDDTESIATNGTQTIHFTTPTVATSTSAIPAGTILYCGALPMAGNKPYERYLGVQAVIATKAIAAGTVNAYVTNAPVGGWKAYPDAAN